MLSRTVLLGLAAIGAQALLVVPEMEPQVDSIDETMSIQPVFEDVTYGVLLPCTDCPFREVNEEGVVSWTDRKPSSLVSPCLPPLTTGKPSEIGTKVTPLTLYTAS